MQRRADVCRCGGRDRDGAVVELEHAHDAAQALFRQQHLCTPCHPSRRGHAAAAAAGSPPPLRAAGLRRNCGFSKQAAGAEQGAQERCRVAHDDPDALLQRCPGVVDAIFRRRGVGKLHIVFLGYVSPLVLEDRREGFPRRLESRHVASAFSVTGGAAVLSAAVPYIAAFVDFDAPINDTVASVLVFIDISYIFYIWAALISSHAATLERSSV